MSKRGPEEGRTEKQKRGLTYWNLCADLGSRLGKPKTTVNERWSCCVKRTLNVRTASEVGEVSDELLTEIKSAIDAHHDKVRQALRSTATRHKIAAKRADQRANALDAPEDIAREDKLRIMLWTVKKLGGVEETERTLKLVKRMMEDSSND